MTSGGLWLSWGEAAYTATGFFWKAGWAFVMGYSISAMIQAFVPKQRLTRYMGDAGPRSVAIASGFGAASSSCSFAALAAARSLVLKGAHFVSAVAFMFASTNLVVELGILIVIFLGWPYLAAEILGGVLLIAISAVLIRVTYPKTWLDEARRKVEEEAEEEESGFDPWQRIRSLEGWTRVGHQFVMEWKMVWKEILVGFVIAGFMKVFVPVSVWEAIFLMNREGEIPSWLLALENAAVAPFVACLTFIGSMGNIPLATVLAGSGVAFAGIMGFIYSDLMVPPLVRVNAKYYGWRVALYIAAIMFVSIVATAMILHFGFELAGLTPEGAKAVSGEDPFAVDYTLFFNMGFAVVAAVMVWLHRRHLRGMDTGSMDHGGDGESGPPVVAFVAIGVLVVGLVLRFVL